MRPLDRLSEYLGAVERRLRLLALTRGAAAGAVAALALTVLAVLVANHFAFSGPSVTGARVFLFLGLAFALAAALIVPLIRLNARKAAREAEHRYPQFEERLLTFSERMEQNADDPFLHLLADDTLAGGRADRAEGSSPHLLAFRLFLRRSRLNRGAALAGPGRTGLPGLRGFPALGWPAQGRQRSRTTP